MQLDLATVTAAAFAERIGTGFTVGGSGAGLALTLAEVTPGAGGIRPGGAFVLVFEGPEAPRLSQGTHPLTHPEMGRAEIFLVPIRPPRGLSLYEAVFG